MNLFDPRWKLPLHCFQLFLMVIVIGLSAPRLFMKNQPRTRASTIGLGMVYRPSSPPPLRTPQLTMGTTTGRKILSDHPLPTPNRTRHRPPEMGKFKSIHDPQCPGDRLLGRCRSLDYPGQCADVCGAWVYFGLGCGYYGDQFEVWYQSETW